MSEFRERVIQKQNKKNEQSQMFFSEIKKKKERKIIKSLKRLYKNPKKTKKKILRAIDEDKTYIFLPKSKYIFDFGIEYPNDWSDDDWNLVHSCVRELGEKIGLNTLHILHYSDHQRNKYYYRPIMLSW